MERRARKRYDNSSIDSSEECDAARRVVEESDKKREEGKPMTADEHRAFVVAASRRRVKLYNRLCHLRNRRKEFLEMAEEVQADIEREVKEYAELGAKLKEAKEKYGSPFDRN